MKKVLIVIYSIILVLSLSLNVILLQKIKGNQSLHADKDLNVVTKAFSSATFPQELIGTWNGTANRVVQIFEDGTVYWMYIPSGSPKKVENGMIGVVEENSFVFSKHYTADYTESYASLSDVPNSRLGNASSIYNISICGDNGFSAANVDPRELPYSFVKQNQN